MKRILVNYRTGQQKPLVASFVVAKSGLQNRCVKTRMFKMSGNALEEDRQYLMKEQTKYSRQ